jgi:uncharacterized protein YndB with AHSA1/START domain
MRTLFLAALASAITLCGATRAKAEVAPAPAYGFDVRETATIAAPPARVWAALGRIENWWSSVHAISGDAHNLRLSREPGGCLCEQFPGGGGARRMTVILVEPGKTLQLEGGLGPPTAAGAPSGRLTFALAPAPTGTALTVTFEGGGWAKDGYGAWAGIIDRVLGEQTLRLQRYVETGRAE